MSQEKAKDHHKGCHKNVINTCDDKSVEDPEGRVVTDAVHERFLDSYVFCEECKTTILGDKTNILKHFKKTHDSSISCIYCRGKIFRYYLLSRDQDIESKEFILHNCQDWSK